MADLDDRERVEVSSSIQLWDWLLTAHTQHESVWLVTWKAANQDKYVSARCPHRFRMDRRSTDET